MKHPTVSAELLGETYIVSGEPATVNQVLRLFKKALAEVRPDNRSGEVSSHRLAVMTALVLAEWLVQQRRGEEKRRFFLRAARFQLDQLVRQIENDGC